MTRAKFILSSIFTGLLCWSLNDTLIYKNSLLYVFENIKIVGKIYNNWPNGLFGTNVYKTPESC